MRPIMSVDVTIHKSQKLNPYKLEEAESNMVHEKKNGKSICDHSLFRSEIV